MDSDGKKRAVYCCLAGIWRRESNGSRGGIVFLPVKWNDPPGRAGHFRYF